ncbi:MAG: 2-octaprenyl-3-methyl-6-methoxy-1,4-benzoquinol hydroxylase [Silanimonas sp.]|nr:MAG: 2-octaprenyl-3-methyl-6-methoxy-1,4-benzoquinol hydroxylase [Silanimonas sp.]
MSRERLDALVVGGGIVGAALALGLRQRGLAVALVEAKTPAPWQAARPDLRVYAIAPDSEALLARLGVWEAVRGARVQAYTGMQVWDAGGGRPLRFDTGALGVPRLGHIVEHGLLVDRLWAALAAAGVPCATGAALAAIEEGEAGVVAVLADGRRLVAPRLFGADGLYSRVRSLRGIGTREHDYRARGLVAYLRPAQSHRDTCWQRFLPTGPLALLPCTEGRVSIVWSLPEAEAERLLALAPERFEAELSRASDRVLGSLALDSERVAFPLRRLLAERMLDGRVALLGDAAHGVHPLAGQGVNLGLRDVAGLLDAIDAAKAKRREPLSDTVLQRWAQQRISENTVAAHAFEAIHRLYGNDAPLPTALRGWVLAAANLPPVNRLLWRRAAGL